MESYSSGLPSGFKVTRQSTPSSGPARISSGPLADVAEPDEIVQLQQRLIPPAGIRRIAIDHGVGAVYAGLAVGLPVRDAGQIVITGYVDFPDRRIGGEQGAS